MTSHFMNQPFLVYDGVLGKKHKQGVQQKFCSKQLAAANLQVVPVKNIAIKVILSLTLARVAFRQDTVFFTHPGDTISNIILHLESCFWPPNQYKYNTQSHLGLF